MTIAGAALAKLAAVPRVRVRPIEPRPLTAPRDAIADQISQMRAGGLAAAPQPHDARLDHHAARALARGLPLARLVLEDIGRILASADPRAATHPGRRPGLAR